MSTVQILEEQARRVDPNVYLGRLMWYTVTEDTMVEYQTMIDRLTAAGFTKNKPYPVRNFNVFARVTKDAERKNLRRPGSEIFENWLIRDVAGRAETVITRRLVLELRDPRGKKLDYQSIADVTFDKTNGKITFTFLPESNEYVAGLPTDDAFRVMNIADEIQREIRSEYRRWQGKLNHAAIRVWIRETILEMGGVAVKSGIYFLREEFAKDVDALVEVVASLDNNDCHALPLIDDRKQREMLKRAIEADTRGEVEKLMAEIQEVKKDGKLTPKRFEQILRTGNKLKEKSGDYAKLLATELSEIDSSLELLHLMTVDLTGLQAKATRTRRSAADPVD